MSTHLGQVGNGKELFQLAHQACDQSLQRRVELCSILNRKHFLLQRQQKEGAFISEGGGVSLFSFTFFRYHRRFRYPEKELPLSRVLLQILDQHHEVRLGFLHLHVLLQPKTRDVNPAEGPAR